MRSAAGPPWRWSPVGIGRAKPRPPRPWPRWRSRGKTDPWDGRGGDQGRPHPPLKRREDPVFLSEPHLALGRMHVHVQLVPGHGEVQHGYGVASLGQEPVVGLGQGEGEEGALYPSAVYQQGDVAPVSTVQGRRAHEPLYPVAIPGVVPAGLQQRAGGLWAVHRDEGVAQAAVAGGVQGVPAVHQRPEAYFRVRQGVAGDQVADTGGLRGWGLEELAPRGEVLEEPLYRDGGARGATSGTSGHHHPTPQLYVPAGGKVMGPGDQGHPGHGGDTGQSLAPEAQGGDGVQVRGAGDLAGGVAPESYLHFARGDAAAVVGHPQEVDPATL